MTDDAGIPQAGTRGAPRPDAIFIGAGINALAGALLLARAGWRVLVLEQNKDPGGAVRTEQLTLPGFRHELGAMNLNPFVGSAFYKDVKSALAAKGVEFTRVDHASGLALPGGGFLGITTDRTANLRAIADFSAADAEAWKTWNGDFERCDHDADRL